MADKEFSLLEVQKHTSKTSCWMAIHGKVYDVTPFLVEHPGGEDIMLDTSGRDATREFEDVGHSGDARKELDALLIGSLREMTEEEKQTAAEEARIRGEKLAQQAGSPFATFAKFLLPVVILAVAYFIRKYSGTSQ